MNMLVGILGPKGTFSHLAFDMTIKNAKEVFFDSIKKLIEGLNDDKINAALVPIENSIEGSVNSTIDYLAMSEGINITKEFIIPIHHFLMAKKGESIDAIDKIITHPQPIGQCTEFLSNMEGVVLEYANSTSEGALMVENGRPGLAVIGSENLTKIYKLEILKRNIEDNENNKTRFVLLEKKMPKRTGSDKTSLVFTTKDKPGELHRILSILSIFEVNMLKIESRPAKTVLGEYMFFVDIEGHKEDENIKQAISVIKLKTTRFKVLGSYAVVPLDKI